MEPTEKIKLLAKDKMMGIRRVVKIGDSYGIIIPKLWIEMNAMRIEGEYYFQMHIRDNELILSMLNEKSVEDITVERG